MKKTEVSRRVLMGALGAGAVGAVATVAIGATRRAAWRGARAVRGAAPKRAIAGAAARDGDVAESLVAPLTPGSQLDRWQVARILPLQNGAASVVLSDTRGQQFQLDVCARDRRKGAPLGPGRSELYEVFLANCGNGRKPTLEEHGLAAMALAEVIRSNEHRVPASAFMTLSERLARHGARVHLELT